MRQAFEQQNVPFRDRKTGSHRSGNTIDLFDAARCIVRRFARFLVKGESRARSGIFMMQNHGVSPRCEPISDLRRRCARLRGLLVSGDVARELRAEAVALQLFGGEIMFFATAAGRTPLGSLSAPRHPALARQARISGDVHVPLSRLDVRSRDRRRSSPRSPTAPTRRSAAKRACARTTSQNAPDLVWIFNGDGPPPPVEAHIPEEFCVRTR